MSQPLNGQGIVTSNAGGLVGIDSAKKDAAGKPTFTGAFEFPEQVAAAFPVGAMIELSMRVSAEAEERPSGLVVVNEIPTPEPPPPPTENWKGAAAKTSDLLINPPIEQVKGAMGVVGGQLSGPAPTTADVAPSARSWAAVEPAAQTAPESLRW